MSTNFILPKTSITEHREKLQKKHCAFTGCKEIFMGTGKSKYCVEHRKRKYRKAIDADKVAKQKAEEENKNPNQTIKHKYTDSTTVVMECALKGCSEKFTIQVLPNTYVYPKYCKHHRNEHKRKIFINEREKANTIQM